MSSSIGMFTNMFVAAVVLTQVGTADAAEIRVLCAAGMQPIIQDLSPRFERASGQKLAITFATGGATIERVQGGEITDVVIASQQGIAKLAKANKVVPDSIMVLASTGISMAVRKGAAQPDISSPEALRRVLLAAKSITYLNPADGGASGIHFAKVLDRLGIANEMKPKTVFAPKASAVGVLVANGEADIGVIQYQLLFSVPGIEIVGPLPGDLQSTTVFSAAIVSATSDLKASKALIDFLRTPEARAAVKAKGMEPG